jgi:hypothetical protein
MEAEFIVLRGEIVGFYCKAAHVEIVAHGTGMLIWNVF